MRKISIQFGTNNNHSVNGYFTCINLSNSHHNVQQRITKSNLKEIFAQVNLLDLLYPALSLIDSLNILLANYHFKWIELILSIKEEKCKSSLEYVYLGGILTCCGITRPIGIKQRNINFLIANLTKLISLAIEGINSLNFVDLNSVGLSFDSFSAGILFHELFGHLSEGDVKDIRESFIPALKRNFNVYDVPFYPNQQDDACIKGHSVNLLNSRLNYDTGNLFIYIDRDNVQNNIGIIRQRKLIATRFGLAEVINPNVVISFGGVNIQKHALHIRLGLQKIKKLDLKIPLEDIKEVYTSDNSPIEYSTICQKISYPAVVSFKLPNVYMRLKRPIKFYIQ